ncbi:MAG: hypothetical protein A4E39_00184 [Methanoregulaceae archaeon PtaB.Bin152]|nr:MAG: hypothetical protein A4E39_00184 [Methanoregulaceae archaeon PtaB.Bin152]
MAPCGVIPGWPIIQKQDEGAQPQGRAYPGDSPNYFGRYSPYYRTVYLFPCGNDSNGGCK